MATASFAQAAPDALDETEARTQQLGRLLLARARAYRPSSSERLQDGLMMLMANETLRSRLLRLVDVLSAPGLLEQSATVKALAREYLDRPLPGLPSGLRALFRFGLSPMVPAPLVAWVVRRLIHLIADRFITHGGARGLERTLNRLRQAGRTPSFDLLGEAVLSHAEAAAYRQGYLELIARLRNRPEAGLRTAGGLYALQCSIKLSSLVADFNPIDPEGTLARVRGPLEEVLAVARDAGVGITIDMEQYAFRDLTWELFRRLFALGQPFGDWPDIGIVLQSYLVDSDQQAAHMVAFAQERRVPFQVRLVKGAYWDYETILAQQHGWPVPVFVEKSETDRRFEALVPQLLRAYPNIRLAAASHNLRSHAYAEAVREHFGLPEHAIEHQTLYRTAESVARAVRAIGWEARDYVPAGDLLPGMAYLVRRILENSSQAGFLMRSRLGEDAGHLLAPPRRELQPLPVTARESSPRTAGPVFANLPPARLFRAEERDAFARALGRTRRQWGREYPLNLGGNVVETDERHLSRSPSHPHDQPVGIVHMAGVAEADRAIAIAQKGFQAWSARTWAERAEVLRRAARLLAEQRDTFAAWIVHEAGKNWSGALADVDEAVDYLTFYPFAAAKAALAEAAMAPRGVVAVIPPWNFPIAIPCGMTAAALMAGNAVILKPAEQTPVITHLLVGLLHGAGVPEQAMIHLPGTGETVGRRLVDSPNVDMIAFTGSRAVGIEIYRRAARVSPVRGGIKRVVAEMGGKNPIIVFADADLDEAVSGILQSAFGHANQKCSAASRVFVEQPVFERLKRRLAEAAASLTVGAADDPDTFVNPLIDEDARRRVLRYAEIARDEGEVILDRTQPAVDSWTVGPLLVELRPEQAETAVTAQEEIFGPVLALIPFREESEAIHALNATPYALTAGVFSRRPSRIRRVLHEVRAGNLYVNREITGAQVGIEPFGGFQLSGTGPKAGGEEYLYALLKPAAPQLGSNVGRLVDDRMPLEALALPLTPARGPGPSEPDPLAERAAKLQKALPDRADVWGAAGFLRASAPARTVPGQHTMLNWDRPRGAGLIAVDGQAAPESLSRLVAAALLAGNRVFIFGPAEQRAEAQALLEKLHGAGYSPSEVQVAADGADLLELANGDIEFAATDLDEETTRTLYARLAETPASAIRLKALLTVQDGPPPGSAAFVRQFTLPETIAIRTLHNGADLDLL